MTPEIPPPPHTPLDARISAAVDARADERKRELWRTVTAPILVGCALLVAGGSAALYATAQTLDQRVGEAERRIGDLEDRFQDVRQLQRELTTLATKVDSWRQSDVSTRAVERQNLERRLSRFENLLDNARVGRRRRE